MCWYLFPRNQERQKHFTEIPQKNATKGVSDASSSDFPSTTEPLADFFLQYPSFQYDPRRSSSKEFYRMHDFFEWERDDHEHEDAHEEFKSALVRLFMDQIPPTFRPGTVFALPLTSIQSRKH